MPLASYASLHFNGPAVGAMVTQGQATVIGTPAGYAKAQHVGGGAGSMPSAKATRLVGSLTVINGAATTTYLPMKARARAASIIKVNELSETGGGCDGRQDQRRRHIDGDDPQRGG
jgi:hypothetical protein